MPPEQPSCSSCSIKICCLNEGRAHCPTQRAPLVQQRCGAVGSVVRQRPWNPVWLPGATMRPAPRLCPHNPVPLREGQHPHLSGTCFSNMFFLPPSLSQVCLVIPLVLNFTKNQGALLWAPFCPNACSTYVRSPVICLKHYEDKHRLTCSNLAQYLPGGETGAAPFPSLCLSLPIPLGVTCCFLVWTGSKTVREHTPEVVLQA